MNAAKEELGASQLIEDAGRLGYECPYDLCGLPRGSGPEGVVHDVQNPETWTMQL